MSEKLEAALEEGDAIIRLRFEEEDISFRILHLPKNPVTEDCYRIASLVKGMVSIALEDAQAVVDRGQREFAIEEAMGELQDRIIN